MLNFLSGEMTTFNEIYNPPYRLRDCISCNKFRLHSSCRFVGFLKYIPLSLFGSTAFQQLQEEKEGLWTTWLLSFY